jgi:cell division topological specificity factor
VGQGDTGLTSIMIAIMDLLENIKGFFKSIKKSDKNVNNSKEAAKERLHLVLMQDRANVSADFLDLMKQEIIDVIKKYIEVDESAIDVRLTNKQNTDGTTGAPALYANIPIVNIKQEARAKENKKVEEEKEIIEEAKQIIAETQEEKTKSESNKNEE